MPAFVTHANPISTLATVATVGAVSATQTTGLTYPSMAMSASGWSCAVFVLNVTAAATDVGDTLDVKVQTLIDGDSIWTDVCYFTQVLGNGSALAHVGKIHKELAVTMFNAATALTAGTVRHVFGSAYRLSYVVVDADANSAFTFAVTMAFA